MNTTKNTKNIKNNTKNKLTKKINKLKEYTIEEVAKHNKKTDAWIAINGKVANVTKWIPKHPGGNVIMKGVGRDATSLFNSIGHDDYAKKMLKKYQIGILKK
jgi:cytochrome b involved in lipid metabolism